MKPPTFCRTQLSDRGNAFPFHDPATDAVDCNVAMVSQCLELVTTEQFSARDVRTRGGDMSGPTGTVLATRNFVKASMVVGVDFVRFEGEDVQFVRDLLANDWFVVAYIDYGVIVDTMPKAFQGSRTYRGVHAVGLCGWWRKAGKRTVWEYDPLFDGRHSGYPLGRQAVPFKIIRDAMAGYDVAGAAGYAVRFR